MSIQLIQQYHAKVEKIIRYAGCRNESALRKPFQDLLEAYASSKNLLLVTEVEVRTPGGRRVIPDGTLKDALRQDWGYWESKDEKDDLAAEIAAKFARGYPSSNILFEDTHTAVLYQDGAEVGQARFSDAPTLDALMARFVSYEPPEVTEFHRAIAQFNTDVPALAGELRAIIAEQAAANPRFQAALDDFLKLCQQAINPRVEMADAREMLIQHVLTEDVFMTVFDEPQFHRENAVAHKLQAVVDTFYQGAARRLIRDRIAPYYESVNARAARIYNHTEKQKFLKALYENFYRAYNPKAADRLGVIYTPDEIVRFMIQAADHLCFQHFGRTLGDPGVEILDPATGTGTFITELIEYLPPAQLRDKYRNEIHCNEVAILPYYIANLNIEYTYRQRTGEYLPFENICFVDTLDNVGFQSTARGQLHFFSFVDENAERIQRQNGRRISVIIGNPPYNANQLNENENNKNRDYPDVDRRIKETYIKNSTAQKTKLYDMYARFYRWASDRLDQDGIIAFVSNNSFLDARTFDGFRKVVADEFCQIYILDLGGNVRNNPKLSGTTHNVFGIQIGVAITFLIKKKGPMQRCQIFYARRPEMERTSDKLEFLRNIRLNEISFEPVHPDRNHNWINLTENDWEEMMPVASKDVKASGGIVDQNAIFKIVSTGISTNRDDWVIDLSTESLIRKMSYFVSSYDQSLEMKKHDFDPKIKWSRNLKQRYLKGLKETFDNKRITKIAYRPYCPYYFYYSDIFIDENGLMEQIFGRGKNTIICFTNPGSEKPFMSLISNDIADLHLVGAGSGTQCLPLYRYYPSGERVENITEWALERFRERYGPNPPVPHSLEGKVGEGGAGLLEITKLDLFHYVYAVLHHPAYRRKYAQNLKRGFPRLPFYEDFWAWAGWGQRLADLHLGYETAEPYPLEREDLDPQSIRKAIVPRLVAHKESGVIEVDTLTTLRGVPPAAWDYRLGTYSALEWVLERYKERAPKDPTIREKFNAYRFAGYKEPVIDLLRRVCTVSVETTKILAEMPD